MGEQMVTALDNLANAAVQKKNTVEQLVKSNATLTLTIKSQQQQEEIKCLHSILKIFPPTNHITSVLAGVSALDGFRRRSAQRMKARMLKRKIVVG